MAAADVAAAEELREEEEGGGSESCGDKEVVEWAVVLTVVGAAKGAATRTRFFGRSMASMSDMVKIKMIIILFIPYRYRYGTEIYYKYHNN